jgi:uncharacterized repeat protein (TIGR01451 family)
VKSVLPLLLCIAGVAFGQTLTVNKYSCTAASYTTTLPAVNDVSSACTSTSAVNLSDFVVYFITIVNSASNPGPITLTDSLPTFFVPTAVVCAAFGGASGPASCVVPSPATWTLTGMTIPNTGGAGIVLEIEGYFGFPGSDAGYFTNTAVGTPHTNPVNGQQNTNIASKLVVVDPPMVTWDLAVNKAQKLVGNTLSETLTVTNNSNQIVYLGGFLELVDLLTVNGLIPSIGYTVSVPTCKTTGPGTSCPSLPTTASGPYGLTRQNYLLSAPWTGSSFIAALGTITITFTVTFTPPPCGMDNVSMNNKDYLALTAGGGGTVFDDANPLNDVTSIDFLYAYDSGPCPTGSKSASPSTNVQWWNGSNDTVTYTITVTNHDPINPETLDVVDQIYKDQDTPPFTVAVTSPSCNPSADCGSLNLTPSVTITDLGAHQLFIQTVTLPPGGTVTLTFTAHFTPLDPCQVDTGNDLIINTAGFFSDFKGNPTGAELGSASAAIAMQQLPSCGLQVTKTANATEVSFSPPLPITYTVTYTNTLSTPVTIRTLRDLVSLNGNYPGFQYTVNKESCTPTFGSILTYFGSGTALDTGQPWSGNAVVDLGSSSFVFPASSTMTCSITITPIPPTSGQCGSGNAVSLVNAAYFDPSILPLYGIAQPINYAQNSLPLPTCREVVISKTVDHPTSPPGGTVSFTITVTNAGLDAVSGIVLNDPMPAGFTIVSCAPACASSVGTGTLNVPIGSLAANGTYTIVVTVRVPVVGGNYKNTAGIVFTGTGNVYNLGGNSNNSAQVQVQTPTLAKEFVPTTVASGGTSTMTFIIMNPTGNPTSGISFNDNLPPGLVALNKPVPTTTCGGSVKILSGGQTVAFSGGSIGVNPCQITVTVQAMGCGPIVNQWSSTALTSNITNVTNLDPTNAMATLTVNPCAQNTGYIQICKMSSTTNPVTGNFTFTVPGFSGAPYTVTVPVGGCSAVIPVPIGMVAVTEASATGDIVTNVTAMAGSVNQLVTVGSDGTATVNVSLPNAGVPNTTVVTFTNATDPPGFLEVCKEGSNLSGDFSFTVSGAPSNPYEVPAGACSGAIQVPSGSVTITELASSGFNLSDVSTIPSARLVSKNIPGMSAVVTVVAGDISTETVAEFTNTAVPGQLKICKIAGQNVPHGYPFNFTANGTKLSAPVPAGLASDGGFCVMDGSFPAGTVVTVQEAPEVNGPVEYVPSSIDVSPPDRIVAAPDLANGSVQLEIGPGITEVTFTNDANPLRAVANGGLRICQIAGPGVAVGTQFTFTASVNPPGRPRSQTYTLAAGPPEEGGYCIVDRTFHPGTSLTVSALLPAGTITDKPNGSAVITLGDDIAGVTFTDTALLTISTTILRDRQKLIATGGTPPYIWQITDGALPSGLSLDPSTGEITGTLVRGRTASPVTVTVTDSSSPTQKAAATFTPMPKLKINAASIVSH